jgi:hypothetical protein
VTRPEHLASAFARLSARKRGLLALSATGVAALAVGVAVTGLTRAGGSGEASVSISSTDPGTRHFTAEQSEAPAASRLSESRKPSCYATAYVRRPVTLRRRPRGRPWMRVVARTEWGSPRVFGVVRRDGDWLGVQTQELRNGQVGWLPARRARLDCTMWSLRADLSQRRFFVRRGGRTVRSFAVAIGRPGNATPTGRFTVTDKLRVTDPGSPYGCCVLALSGHQTNLPAGWPGGDRLAVHGTRDLSTIGRASSLGCLRAASRDVRWLIDTMPLGAPVFVRS